MADGCKHGHEANSCTSCYAEMELKRLRATIARVEALLMTSAFGRSKPEPLHEHAVISAKALRKALKGEP